jgi:type IV secretory pathway VirB9-like protein
VRRPSKAFDDGKEVLVTVIKAMDQEKIIAFDVKN